MVAGTVDRVPRHTSHDINRQIERRIAESGRWHAAQGLCPPLPVLRLGFRTAREIETGQYALRALWGLWTYWPLSS